MGRNDINMEVIFQKGSIPTSATSRDTAEIKPGDYVAVQVHKRLLLKQWHVSHYNFYLFQIEAAPYKTFKGTALYHSSISDFDAAINDMTNLCGKMKQ